jgi:hypothetical protein
MVNEELANKYNYKLAIDAIHELEEHTKRCSLRVPELSGVSVRFIEASFQKEEIGEQDHNMLLDRVSTANSKFLHDCGCRTLSLISMKNV